MEDYSFLGAYWTKRTMTLREYADAVKAYLQSLQKLHPAFNEIYHGTEASDVVKLADDLSNVDDLVYERSWDRKAPPDWYTHKNLNGTPSWHLTSEVGFGMHFHTDPGYRTGRGISMHVNGGTYFPDIPNVVTIDFPRHDHPEFAAKYPDFHSYAFLKRLLTFTVNFWRPEAAFVTSKSFRDKVDFKDDSVYDENWQVGWLTYLENRKVASVLSPKIEHEFLNVGGVLITTTRELISATNPEHVATALQIRDTLHAKGLLRRTD